MKINLIHGLESIYIRDENVNHIKNVLRYVVKDKIEITTIDDGTTYVCEIEELNKEEIKCKILNKIEQETESDIYINVIQGLPKSDKMELIIEKCTELGVKEFTPIALNRCVVKLDKKEEEKKILRWQKIIHSSSEQSKRSIIPRINNIYNIKNIFDLISNYDIVLVAYENEKENSLKHELKKINLKSNLKIAIVIGPEGGFEESEILHFKQSGSKIVSLGNRILRTETASIAMVNAIMYEFEK